eukprot:scaffold355222_cov44-Prasinocladus_malaysianus.AAC.2
MGAVFIQVLNVKRTSSCYAVHQWPFRIPGGILSISREKLRSRYLLSADSGSCIGSMQCPGHLQEGQRTPSVPWVLVASPDPTAS